jgi:hypothetical protein
VAPGILEETLVPLVLEMVRAHGDRFSSVPDGRLVHDTQAHQLGPDGTSPAETELDGRVGLR